MSRKPDYDHMENIVMGEVQRINDAADPMQGMFDLGLLAGFLSKMTDQVRDATIKFANTSLPKADQTPSESAVEDK